VAKLGRKVEGHNLTFLPFSPFFKNKKVAQNGRNGKANKKCNKWLKMALFFVAF
jgi:hypothetical protein